MNNSDKLNAKELEKKAYELRIEVIKMLEKAESGHVAGPLGMADIFASLYYRFAKIDPKKPKWEDRDYILLSNGHICPIWYAVLGHLGFFDKKEFEHLRELNHLLQGHPNLTIPGVENASGPLGHGLSQAIGISLGLRLDNRKNKVVCLMSDGEHQEGQVWEAVMSASKWGLENLIAIMDCNGIQIEGTTDEIMPLGSLKEKYESFGWIAVEIDGNDYAEIIPTLEFAFQLNQPIMIIAHTQPGKGVRYMEEAGAKYHDWKGEKGDADKAIADLEEKFKTL